MPLALLLRPQLDILEVVKLYMNKISNQVALDKPVYRTKHTKGKKKHSQKKRARRKITYEAKLLKLLVINQQK
jgi:hypothetical protein